MLVLYVFRRGSARQYVCLGCSSYSPTLLYVGIKQCCNPSIRLSVCLLRCPLARWRYARVAASNAFDRGQQRYAYTPARLDVSSGSWREHIATSHETSYLGPFHGAIAVPSVTRCRRCRGHRCAGGARQYR